MLAAIRARSDAHRVSTLLFLLSGVLLVLAALALARSLTRGPGATLTLVGACVLALGGMGHAMQSVLMLTTRALAASDLDQSQLAAALQNLAPTSRC